MRLQSGTPSGWQRLPLFVLYAPESPSSRSDSSPCTVSPSFTHLQAHAIDRSAPFNGRGDTPHVFGVTFNFENLLLRFRI